jgi:hypothetical protein
MDGVRIAHFTIHYTRQYVYPTPEQELQQLRREKAQRKSLVERILENQKRLAPS